jgi:transposase
MTTNTKPIGVERASVDTGVTIKLGLDVHAEQVPVCRQVEGQVPKPAYRSREAEVVAWVQEQVAHGAKVYSCYEAGPCGYGLHRRLTELGATNYVVAPQRWNATSRVKTDQRDARQLCQRLDQYVRGEPEAFSVVRVPTPAQEQRRALGRQRGLLLKERPRCALRGHGLTLAQGVRAPADWWVPANWREFAPQLPAWLRPPLERWQQQALRLDEELQRLTPQIEAQVAGQARPKGLGALAAALLDSEILDWSRFENRRGPASYTGLCPSETSSGESRRQGSVTKHGNPRVRHLLIEAI